MARARAARGRYGRNAVVQGAAAELFKTWAVLVRNAVRPLDATIVLCLHDELLVEAAAADADEVAAAVRACLDDAVARWTPPTPAVRFVAGVDVVRRWSDVPGH
jgi:DNA polymerase-1